LLDADDVAGADAADLAKLDRRAAEPEAHRHAQCVEGFARSHGACAVSPEWPHASSLGGARTHPCKKRPGMGRFKSRCYLPNGDRRRATNEIAAMIIRIPATAIQGQRFAACGNAASNSGAAAMSVLMVTPARWNSALHGACAQGDLLSVRQRTKLLGTPTLVLTRKNPTTPGPR